jgi:hypothetical protein
VTTHRPAVPTTMVDRIALALAKAEGQAWKGRGAVDSWLGRRVPLFSYAHVMRHRRRSIQGDHGRGEGGHEIAADDVEEKIVKEWRAVRGILPVLMALPHPKPHQPPARPPPSPSPRRTARRPPCAGSPSAPGLHAPPPARRPRRVIRAAPLAVARCHQPPALRVWFTTPHLSLLDEVHIPLTIHRNEVGRTRITGPGLVNHLRGHVGKTPRSKLGLVLTAVMCDHERALQDRNRFI